MYIKKFNTFLNESLGVDAEKDIYRMVDSNVLQECRSCDDCDDVGYDNPIECHCAILMLEDLLSEKEYYDELEFLFWDEDKWDEVIEQMTEDAMTFNCDQTNTLYEDIKNGYTNGHSFIQTSTGVFIDPHLYDMGCGHGDIQEFCGYFYKFLKK